MKVIYEFINKTNGKSYIGQTINYKKRIKDHQFNYKNNLKKTPFYSALKKYGWNNFEINIIEECSEKLLNEKEIYWISEKKSLYPNGYNLLEGGNQAKHTDITRQKISERRKGMKFSEKHIENLKKSHLGYVMPEEQKIKISQSNKGKIVSEDTRKKLKYLQPHRKEVGRFDINGTLIKKYDSIKDASKELNCSPGNISECCNGKRKMKRILKGDTLKFL
jgi:group I intron endonuclease